MNRTFAKAAGIATFIAALLLGAMVGAGGAHPEQALTNALLTVSPVLAASLGILAAALLTRTPSIEDTAPARRALANIEWRAEQLDH